MLPKTNSRVAESTPAHINAAIREQTIKNIQYYATQNSEAITYRIAELDEEWDIERALTTNASAAVLTGMFFGFLGKRSWFLLPVAVGGFLLQHSLQGWCPPLAIFRRLGIRTADEIAQEKYALMILRGDFDEILALRG